MADIWHRLAYARASFWIFGGMLLFYRIGSGTGAGDDINPIALIGMLLATSAIASLYVTESQL